MYQIIADGTPWEDSDGNDEWTEFEVYSYAESVERRGYVVEVVKVSGLENPDAYHRAGELPKDPFAIFDRISD